jgi:GDP-mannose 6-dehydrogenase
MRIGLFGLGYVGTVGAACLANRGHTVIGVDKFSLKVDLIRSGRSPIVEPGIDDLIRRAVNSGCLMATEDAAEAVAASDMSIICVGTPGRPDGTLRLDALEAVVGEIGRAIRAKGKRHTVVVRSTVTPGTTRGLVATRLAELADNTTVGVAFNPEFLREGSAVADFNNPSRTVVGATDQETANEVMSLYRDLPGRKITTGLEIAEFLKYVDNAWHALKVAFGNETGIIAKALGLRSHDVMDIFFADERLNISSAYMRPGFAFGGSCLPKDLRALTQLGRTLDLSLPVLGHILDSNRLLIERGADWILDQSILGQSKRRVAILGISFKPGTDDVRESPFVELAARLIQQGCDVRIFDSNVRLASLVGANKEYLMRALPSVADLMVTSAADAISWGDVVVVTVVDPSYAAAIAQAPPDQTILDLAGLPSGCKHDAAVKGFLW